MKETKQTQDDFRLIRAYRSGTEGAFEELVRKYQRQVANVIYLSLGNRAEVEDLTQEVFIRVHRSLPKFEFDASFFSWLYRITMNLCIDEIRRRKLKRMLSLDFLAEGALEREQFMKDRTLASDEVMNDEKKTMIQSAIRRLSKEHREIIVLREYQDFSYNELAETLGISLEAVKSRIFRAREELRRMLKDYFKERT
ncbi:MAG: sigma-70 family RNA polymerase sigma factor [Ignavibacteriales bacterium]|nr:sigma-70 family RNA polymerase sigma factor [Ignavibacteriales bacterium]